MSIPERLSALLKEKNISQAELAHLIGVVPMTVSKWVTGKNIPETASLEKVANALKIPLSRLVDGRVKETPVTQPPAVPRLSDALKALDRELSTKPQQPTAIDHDALRDVIEICEEILRLNRSVPSADEKAEMISLVYEELMAKPAAERTRNCLLRLVSNTLKG